MIAIRQPRALPWANELMRRWRETWERLNGQAHPTEKCLDWKIERGGVSTGYSHRSVCDVGFGR